ncbi:MAG TPA: exonuclease SbcCD subunit D [Gemmatimonadales bacterium]|nr:exonuclease SbcCD subunit D [Gemmatimonadales bacterium]
MRLAHLADLHLGFRQYYRLTPEGINQREADVAHAFRAAVDGLLAERPDAIVIAGDLFHAVRPSNRSIVFAYQELQRLRAALPDTPVVAIAGNHDTPRSSDVGTILRLYEELGIHVAADEPRRLVFPELGLSVLAVPHAALEGEPIVVRPEGSEPFQVLVIHGEVGGLLPIDQAAMEYGGALLDPEPLRREPWSYVALGHFHVQHAVSPRCWYSGSLEYVGPNIWGELADESLRKVPGKGWLLADLAAGTVSRRSVPASRTIYEAPTLNAFGLSPAEVDRLLAERLAAVPGGLGGSIVRVVIENIPRPVMRELDHAAIRDAKAEALHLHLDFRRPESIRTVGVGAPGRRQTLPELVSEFLGRRPLPERLSRERFVSLGLELLAEPDARTMEETA